VTLENPPATGGSGSGSGSSGGELGPDAGSAGVTGPADAAPGVTTATSFIAQYGDKQCDEAFACESSDPAGASDFATNWGTSVANCYADAQTFFNPTKIERDILAGRVTFDPIAAAECLAGIVFGTCANFWQTFGTYPDACNTALVGSVAVGGGCVSDFECQTLYCNASAKCATP
jgi:hypothetical protein